MQRDHSRGRKPTRREKSRDETEGESEREMDADGRREGECVRGDGVAKEIDSTAAL